MALAMNMGDFQYYMNMSVFELLNLCEVYNELNREIRNKRREEMKRK